MHFTCFYVLFVLVRRMVQKSSMFIESLSFMKKLKKHVKIYKMKIFTHKCKKSLKNKKLKIRPALGSPRFSSVLPRFSPRFSSVLLGSPCFPRFSSVLLGSSSILSKSRFGFFLHLLYFYVFLSCFTFFVFFQNCREITVVLRK
jgi:hypothetical protein